MTFDRSVEDPVRLLPEVPSPSYSYATRRFPHPTRDPRGHSYRRPEDTVAPPDPDRWRQCRLYLRGIDLFNFGYYWEAHEAWETLWHAAGRNGILADFLKGLIALAAVGVKAREDRARGVRQHTARARALFTGVQDRLPGEQREFMGLQIPAVLQALTPVEEHPEAILNTAPQPVVVVMPFALKVNP
jgi:predicted metal-dependent hydrolase